MYTTSVIATGGIWELEAAQCWGNVGGLVSVAGAAAVAGAAVLQMSDCVLQIPPVLIKTP